MSTFLARIELHGASATDYENLHERLSALGFSRVVTADNGSRLRLPDATYTYTSGSLSSSESVGHQVKEVAQSIRNSSVFVCEYSTWYGYLHNA